MGIERVSTASFSSNVYRVGDVLFDVGTSLDALPDDVEHVFLTHSHADHIGVLRPYVERTGASVHTHPDELEFLRSRTDELRRSAEELGFDESFYEVEFGLVDDGDVFGVGDEEFEVLHTPGHTPGSLCFYFPEDGDLVSGDTVLGNGSPGVNEDAGGDRDLLADSVEELSSLDVDTIYPGHG
ncbi:MAG: MBL fold metallo-hydrolase, partial [Halobacteria archaeon]|nr:MBL fold metallo-hydrolase [Halobacteria archaeon]